jgi:hypothetical protein
MRGMFEVPDIHLGITGDQIPFCKKGMCIRISASQIGDLEGWVITSTYYPLNPHDKHRKCQSLLNSINVEFTRRGGKPCDRRREA